MENRRSKASGNGRSSRTLGPKVIFAETAKAKDKPATSQRGQRETSFRTEKGQRRENERDSDQENNAGSKIAYPSLWPGRTP